MAEPEIVGAEARGSARRTHAAERTVGDLDHGVSRAQRISNCSWNPAAGEPSAARQRAECASGVTSGMRGGASTTFFRSRRRGSERAALAPATSLSRAVANGQYTRGRPVTGILPRFQATLVRERLRLNPLDVLPQPFRFLMSLGGTPRRVWADATVQLELTGGEAAPAAELNGIAVSSFARPER